MRGTGVSWRHRMASFGDNVRATMARLGITTVQMAKDFEIKTQSVDKYMEAAYANPGLLTVIKIAKYLGVSIESLCERIDDEYDQKRASTTDEAAVLELWRRMTDDQRRVSLPMLRVMVDAPVPPSPAAPTTAQTTGAPQSSRPGELDPRFHEDEREATKA